MNALLVLLLLRLHLGLADSRLVVRACSGSGRGRRNSSRRSRRGRSVRHRRSMASRSAAWDMGARSMGAGRRRRGVFGCRRNSACRSCRGRSVRYRSGVSSCDASGDFGAWSVNGSRRGGMLGRSRGRVGFRRNCGRRGHGCFALGSGGGETGRLSSRCGVSHELRIESSEGERRKRRKRNPAGRGAHPSSEVIDPD